MSDCNCIQELLGSYLDGEAAPGTCREVEGHLASCQTCARLLDELRALATAIGNSVPAAVPSCLWHQIENRLDQSPNAKRSFFAVMRRRSGFALAASIAVVIGLGLFAMLLIRDGGSQVQAATVDFSKLLNALQADARAAFEQFLVDYDAKATTPAEAIHYAPKLNFDLPATLPGGFELKATYILNFGESPGVAARYERSGEFLAALFHTPVLREDFGTHKDRSCIVGKHRGHSVPVGEWSLVHLTDPSTCHCVLSRLNEHTELPAVMAAVAPRSASMTDESHDHHHNGP